MSKPKICAYVQSAYAKQTYKNECLDARQFVGLRVIIHVLEQAGYSVDFAGIDTVHEYDYVLVSLTADCDWYPFIRERLKWRKGHYKVIIGGAGVLHISPFLPFGDYFMFGRGEDNILGIIDEKHEFDSRSIARSEDFSEDREYIVRQASRLLSDLKLPLNDKKTWTECAIGCNHKCYFCGYTWHRRWMSDASEFVYNEGVNFRADQEAAILDMKEHYDQVNFASLRTTAIDGISERLRMLVNKPIKNEDIYNFLIQLDRVSVEGRARPHEVRFFNIVGYPTETREDYDDFYAVLERAEENAKYATDKPWLIKLHSTPFKAMPATPMACAPMSYKNYRGEIWKSFSKRDKSLKPGFFFRKPHFHCAETVTTESLPTVIMSAIANRASRDDTENLMRLCSTPKFWSAGAEIKKITLEKYFDVKHLFGAFTAETLPSRYLNTPDNVKVSWRAAFQKRFLTDLPF